jgi:hypothetical protein
MSFTVVNAADTVLLNNARKVGVYFFPELLVSV